MIALEQEKLKIENHTHTSFFGKQFYRINQ